MVGKSRSRKSSRSCKRTKRPTMRKTSVRKAKQSRRVIKKKKRSRKKTKKVIMKGGDDFAELESIWSPDDLNSKISDAVIFPTDLKEIIDNPEPLILKTLFTFYFEGKSNYVVWCSQPLSQIRTHLNQYFSFYSKKIIQGNIIEEDKKQKLINKLTTILLNFIDIMKKTKSVKTDRKALQLKYETNTMDTYFSDNQPYIKSNLVTMLYKLIEVLRECHLNNNKE